MNNPLVSIVVPVYNLENYIEKTLDCIFQQTYKNIEVIAVNDGSRDNSAQILDRYAKKESRLVVFHKENGGVTSARISGIELARGEFIGFVDGDDLIDNDMYERLVHNALENNADISHCGYRVINNNKIEFFYNTSKTIIQSTHSGLVDLLEGKFIEPGLWNKLFKRELFDIVFNNKRFDRSIAVNEDLLMNYFLFRAADKSVFEDFCPYQYIKRDGSASQNDNRLIFYSHPFYVRKIIVDDCVGTQEENFAKKIAVSKIIHMISILSIIDRPDLVNIRDEMILTLKEYKRYIFGLPIRQMVNGLMLIVSPKCFYFINKKYRNKR